MENLYRIKDLENLTGIKAHTIRIWEKRYKVLTPKRTDSNIRYYTMDDLKKILNISLLYNEGHKISKIADLNKTEIDLKVSEVLMSKRKTDSLDHETLLQGILALDTEFIESTLEELYERHGMVDLYLVVIQPVLVRIGELWQMNSLSISHEHLFSNILRKFVLAKTDAVQPKTSHKQSVLLFLIHQEQHELPILFYHFILKELGWKCIYLGQNVPLEDLELTYKQTEPDLILTSFISTIDLKQLTKRLQEILDIIPSQKLCLSGGSIIMHRKDIPSGIKVIENMIDFNNIFNTED